MARSKGKAERDPAAIGALLPQLVAGRGWGERIALGRLRDQWPAIVGEQVAARSEPVALSRGVLTVRADGGAWASELTLLARTLAEKVDAFLGGESVREVRVSAGSA